MRKIPPLAAVRVFEAAARHENFTAAARELGMTQAAVSHQIRLIETYLGQQVFRRERQRVVLTDAARRVASRIGKGLDMIEAGFAEMRVDDDSTLTISTTPTFANAWLAWRIGRFQMRYPDMAVRLLMQEGLADLSGDGVDVAVRLGHGSWPDLAAHRLIEQDFTPMCSPGFLADQGGHIRPEDLLRLPLISPHDPSWTCWLQQAGLMQVGEPALQGVRMDSQANEGHAAMAGQGVAMLTPFFWHQDMSDRRLVKLFPQVSSLGAAYWLVYPEHRRRTPKIRRFREWLLAEIGVGAKPVQA
ncbi:MULTISPECIES: LysR substrate-binding domain-containing protein [unclassified Novosphingobium]|uniref:LysR substrate-binding domain-containing protein n=1 Tax=unclassified Novosphingobium TaxID=2644732 RepID=UPI00086DE436|nr:MULTISPECIES: LysR substrate-binding domain-containing protein [unclassified Novosphingobium]MBN9144523.1 LysR family transcriptional regulator [Novosphingobium sp.]MDR6707854.1 LysR family glycine cleavage system transcriptional activator [Novosphingobium sp. 1748]ODU84068.1 MAG: LysR family transcriptional regulator [Novosphingobium sp. SCN 63-17]OJX93621.1 MAG: LysR family transcriptional regulator [Novosphingobium sp. 63-713]